MVCVNATGWLRVNEAWETVDSFNEICRPKNESFQQWQHVAFRGRRVQEFLQAPSATEVIHRFRKWLQEDDILLWWGQESPECLRKFLKWMKFPELEQESYSVQATFRRCVRDGKRTKGGLYLLAKLRWIKPMEPEHCAVNDVQMFRKLLAKVDFQLEYLHQPINHTPKAQPVPANGWPFLIDVATGMLHKPDCERLPTDAKTTGCVSFSAAIKKHHTVACMSCCKSL